jgi:hypothetical protein
LNKFFAPSFALALALSAATFSAGCNSYPTGSVQAPRSVVMLDSMQIPADAPLAVSLDVRPLLKGRRSVQQVAPAPTFGPVTSIEVMVSGGNLTSPVTQSIRVADCKASGQASFLFYLPAGTYKVVLNALDAAGQRVSYAVKEGVQVSDNVQTLVPVTCTPTTGSILIQWTCSTNCGPSPTPTPSPLNPPGTLLGPVSAIAVDSQNRLYLAGQDPAGIITPSAASPGRLIRVLPDLTLESTTQPFYDDMHLAGDLEVVNDKIYVPKAPVPRTLDPNGYGAHEISVGGFPGSFTTLWPGRTGFGRFARSKTDRLVGTMPGFFALLARDLYNWPINYYWYNGTDPASNDYLPALTPSTMVFDKDDNLLFTGKVGISRATPGTTGSLPTILAPLPATLPAAGYGAVGMVALAADSTQFLVTYDQDTRVYLWDEASAAAPMPIQDFAPLYPRKLERSSDGHIYILSGDITTTDSFRGMFSKYKVTKHTFESSTSKLVEDQVMVEVK